MKRTFFLFLCCLILAPLWHAVAATKKDDAQEKEQINFSDVGRIRRSIASGTAKLDASYEQEHSLLVELDTLDRKINEQQEIIEKITGEVRKQEDLIAEKNLEEQTLTQKNEELKNYMIPRLRTFYLRGNTGFLDVMFTTRTLPDLVLMKDSFHFLVEHDREIFLTYQASLKEVKQAKLASSFEKAVHEGQLAGMDRERQKLQTIVEEKNELLKKVQTQKELYLMALKEMKQVEEDLTTALSQHNNNTSFEDDFFLSKGKLPPPVWGNVIRRFGVAVSGEEDAIFTNGITLATPDPIDVIAVYAGEVVFADFMPGYGQVVIIHHDQDYYSVTARFDEIKVHEGDWVEQGQTIGTTGEIATLFGQGLYFEIRRDANPENPLDWLQPGLPIYK